MTEEMSDGYFLLAHGILKVLYDSRTIHQRSYSANSGIELINKVSIETSHLRFGNLVYALNLPEKYKSLPREDFNEPEVKYEEIDDPIYPVDHISFTIDILQHNNHVKDELIPFGGIQKRLITLTNEGVIALLNQQYLKEYKQENYTDQLQKSILNTNKWMTILTWVIAIATAGPLIVQMVRYFFNGK